MKIISWNCNMAFRKKSKKILDLNPDIIVIQECESKEKFVKKFKLPNVKDFLWFGKNKNKGIAIISFGSFKISLRKDYNTDIEYVIPLEVRCSKSNNQYILFAIWAMPHKQQKLGYVGRIWTALQYYQLYSKDNHILIGDFNSNQIWDQERKSGNHSMVNDLLNTQKIESLYHHFSKDAQGQESIPTFYLLKNKSKKYHLDYCYTSKNLITSKTTFQIGPWKDWIKLSDHMPIIIDHLHDQ